MNFVESTSESSECDMGFENKNEIKFDANFSKLTKNELDIQVKK